MPLAEKTHVTFTNKDGGEEVGVVKSHSGSEYSIERKSGDVVQVAESSVKEFHPSSVDKDSCPVVGHK